MLTIKFQTVAFHFLLMAAVIGGMGCGSRGAGALFKGKRLLEQGKYDPALEAIASASMSMGQTNAQALNYLGLASHYSGRLTDAVRAYQRALLLDPDLSEARYNLGCLWAEQNKVDSAKAEFTAFTLRRPGAAEGWLKLGNLQLRLNESSAAEKSFSEALRLSARSAEGLTGLGLARLQRGHPAEAARFFNQALTVQPDYGPALLDLAIVAHQHLKDPAVALEKYRNYLALKPAPENSDAVRTLLRQLGEEQKAIAASPPARDLGPITNTVSAHSNPPPVGQNQTTSRLALATPTGSSVSLRSSSATDLAKPVPPATPGPTSNLPRPTPASSSPAPAPVEVVRLADEPVFKAAQDPSPVSSAPTEAGSSSASRASGRAPAGAKTLEAAADPEVQAVLQNTPRYVYRSPTKLASGNRAEAERSLAQGVQAHRAQHLPEAIQAYRRAAGMDPSFFDAQYNLGLAAAEAGNASLALTAYESALAIRPASLDARYNFALLLKQGGFLIDSVNELERILKAYPNDSRSHLALGNLYAQQLRQPAKARAHYLKVLENDPRNPQAGPIRYWLTENDG
jgi:tetratricopeptide (TPR) repeat protein